MSCYRAVIFDLDGTLLDTIDDLADSMNAALASLGFPGHPVASYNYFVGDGLTTLCRRVLPAPAKSDETLIERCSEVMLQEYNLRWTNKSKLYPGIAPLLSALLERGLELNILSNKPDGPTQKAVQFFIKDWPFQHIVGAKPDVPRKPDPTAALDIAEKSGYRPADFLYLGDTNTDMTTAVSAGMKAVGVLWGFRTKEELINAGAELTLEKPLDLLAYL